MWILDFGVFGVRGIVRGIDLGGKRRMDEMGKIRDDPDPDLVGAIESRMVTPDGRSGHDNRLVDYPRLDLEIHNTQGGGLKDINELYLTRSQRHGDWKGQGLNPSRVVGHEV